MRKSRTRFLSWLMTDAKGALVLLLLLVLTAVGCLYAGQKLEQGLGRLIFEAVAMALLVSAVLQLNSRTRLWYDVTEQLLDRVQLSQDVKDAGLRRIAFFDELPLKDLFHRSETVRFVAIAAQPLLLGQGTGNVRAFLGRKGRIASGFCSAILKTRR